jgi:hypothetical protein
LAKESERFKSSQHGEKKKESKEKKTEIERISVVTLKD